MIVLAGCFASRDARAAEAATGIDLLANRDETDFISARKPHMHYNSGGVHIWVQRKSQLRVGAHLFVRRVFRARASLPSRNCTVSLQKSPLRYHSSFFGHIAYISSRFLP